MYTVGGGMHTEEEKATANFFQANIMDKAVAIRGVHF